MSYAFIESHTQCYPVEKMYRCMKVSKNAYYHWLRKKNSSKQISQTDYLRQRIKTLFYENKCIYGSPKIQEALRWEGLHYSRAYIARLMKQMGLRSIVRKKFVVTTDSKHSFPITPNILNQDFSCEELGKKWVSDITYVRVGQSWNYLTTIMDLADRKIIGWSLSVDMTAENTIKAAWVRALQSRQIKPGFIFHSDRGVQYACKQMSQLFTRNLNLNQSMSRKGNCWDNAVSESFFKTIKTECTYNCKYQNYEEAFQSIREYIEWYDTKGYHSSLGYLTPLGMEQILRKINLKHVA